MADSILNKARWDDNVRQWTATGGPQFSTQVQIVQSGDEQRAANWVNPKGMWNVGDRSVPNAEYQKLLSFFYRMRGRFYGFRIRDWTDFRDDGRGVLGTGIGTGALSYQMNKIRAVPDVAGATYQKITRPVGPSFTDTPELGNTIEIFLNGLPVPQGSGAGSCYVNDETGVVLFNPYTWDISSVTGGNTLVFTENHNLSVNEWLVLSGFTGGQVSNNKLVQVTSVVSPTSVQVAQPLINGTPIAAEAANLPGPTDQLTWTGTYDIPARFDTDSFTMNMIDAFIEQGADTPKDVWVRLGSIPVVQLRE